MKKSVFIISNIFIGSCICIMLACSHTKNANVTQSFLIANVEASNPSAFARLQEPLYFAFYDLGLAANDPKIAYVAAIESNRVLPSEIIDTDGDGKADSLLVAPDFASNQTLNIQLVSDASIKHPLLKKQTQAEISIKEGGQWNGKVYENFTHFKNVQKFTPPPQYTDHSYFIRYEGPGIESDKVAYRVYLDWRNGFDIFGKKVDGMVLQNIGPKDYEEYHHDAPWGQDVLKVGKSLGTGGFGFWNGRNVELVSDVKTREALIVANGPLYSDFNIKYNQWKTNNNLFDVSTAISMNAGSRLAHVRLKITEPEKSLTGIDPRAQVAKDLPNIAIGLVKHPGTKLLQGSDKISNTAWTYAASWGKQSLCGKDDYLGMAVIFKRGDRKQQTQDANSYVSVMDSNGGNLDYYFLAAWDKEKNGIKTETEFKAYLEQEVERLTKPVRLRIHTSFSDKKKNTWDAEAALQWSKRLANSELQRKTLNYYYGGWDEFRQRPVKFEYDVVGMQVRALQELNKRAPNPRYPEALETVTGSFIGKDGKIATFQPDLFSIDTIKPGEAVILLEQRTHDQKYRKAADKLRENLRKHPRTSEGGFWHRSTYPNQLWLDGVYMGMPFLVQYAATYETGAVQHKSFEEAVHEFLVVREHLRDTKTGLYYHAWDESKNADWANKQSGHSAQFWSRGMGWYAMALVDVLDYLPDNEKNLRKNLIDIIQELAPALIQYQDAPTGTWWQITDKPGASGNYRESTASAMFTYFLTKSVNQGYLPATYKDVAIKSYRGLVKEFISIHPDGKISMTNQCLVAGLGFGRDGSYEYYMTEPIVQNDPKGNAPFILAGLEIYQLLNK